MHILYWIVATVLLLSAGAGLVVFAARRGWLTRCGCRSDKQRLPRRIWRKGGKYNYMELFEQPDGGLLYHIHRAYEVKCPRCLETNTSGWLWTVNHQEGVDPLPKIGSPRMSFRCKRCGDVHSYVPQVGPSEWADGAPQ